MALFPLYTVPRDAAAEPRSCLGSTCRYMSEPVRQARSGNPRRSPTRASQAVDGFEVRRDTRSLGKGGSDVVEPGGYLRRNLFVRADVPVQPLLRPRSHLRLLSRDSRLQYPKGC